MRRNNSPAPPIIVGEVQIIPVKPRNGLIGFASCVLNYQLYLGSIAIHTRPDGCGIRLVYPSKILPNGLSVSCVHPIRRETGDVITGAVAEKMQELASKCGELLGEDGQIVGRQNSHQDTQ